MMDIVFQAAAAIVALTAAIMAWRLERRLTRLKSGQDGMQAAAAALAEAVTRAEAGVRALRADGAETARELETLIARARATSDELRLLQSPRSAAARDRDEAPARELERDLAQDLARDRDNVRRLPSTLRAGESGLADRLRRVR